ncbi:MAG: hypothetical protein J0L81_13095 [Caulobacterales bacterium]|jgi:hypothetical protein|nr:hypothetical protein [Caulobacterales bacterium]
MPFPLICLLAILWLSFDLWRAFDDSGVLGRPWPNARRESNAPLFWAFQAFRGIVLLGFVVLGVTAMWG